MFGEPKLVVLDEPNSNLDGDSEARLTARAGAPEGAGHHGGAGLAPPDAGAGRGQGAAAEGRRDGDVRPARRGAAAPDAAAAAGRGRAASPALEGSGAPPDEHRTRHQPDAPPRAPAHGRPRTRAGTSARRDFGSALPPFPRMPCWTRPRRAPAGRWCSAPSCSWSSWSASAPGRRWRRSPRRRIAPGMIKVEGNRRTVQHLEGGIVREILVRDGDQVEAGQVLMRLDDVQSDTTAETQRAQRWALLAQDARLVAELGKPASRSRSRPSSSPAPSRAPGTRCAASASCSRRAPASLNSQVQVLRARIEQQQAAIRGARGQLAATAQPARAGPAGGADPPRPGGPGSRPPAGTAAVQRARAGLEGTMQDLNGQIDRASAAIAEAERQIQQALDQRQQEVSTELREVRAKLAETEERLRAGSRRGGAAGDPGARGRHRGEPAHLHPGRRGEAGRPGAGPGARPRPAGGGGQHPALRHRRGLSRAWRRRSGCPPSSSAWCPTCTARSPGSRPT